MKAPLEYPKKTCSCDMGSLLEMLSADGILNNSCSVVMEDLSLGDTW